MSFFNTSFRVYPNGPIGSILNVLTNNKDVNVLILSKLNFDDLCNVLLVNRTLSQYNNNILWYNFWKEDYDFEIMEKIIQRSWKEFSFLFVKYLNISYGVYDVALYHATKDGNKDLVDFFKTKLGIDITTGRRKISTKMIV